MIYKLKDILMEEKVIDTAGIILRSPDAGIVLCKEPNSEYTWGIPKGKIDLGETPIQAAVRETIEEASILVTVEGSKSNTPIKEVAIKKNSRGGKYYIYECTLTMPVIPVKSLEHEEVKWCETIPEGIDPRLEGLL